MTKIISGCFSVSVLFQNVSAPKRYCSPIINYSKGLKLLRGVFNPTGLMSV